MMGNRFYRSGTDSSQRRSPCCGAHKRVMQRRKAGAEMPPLTGQFSETRASLPRAARHCSRDRRSIRGRFVFRCGNMRRHRQRPAVGPAEIVPSGYSPPPGARSTTSHFSRNAPVSPQTEETVESHHDDPIRFNPIYPRQSCYAGYRAASVMNDAGSMRRRAVRKAAHKEKGDGAAACFLADAKHGSRRDKYRR